VKFLTGPVLRHRDERVGSRKRIHDCADPLCKTKRSFFEILRLAPGFGITAYPHLPFSILHSPLYIGRPVGITVPAAF
jgi:hypothetical protein